MKDIVNEWNLLDTFLYKLDIVIFKMREAFGKPDAESIIEAETAHLKKENEQLKKLGYPRPVIKLDRNYFCPKCNIGITKQAYFMTLVRLAENERSYKGGLLPLFLFLGFCNIEGLLHIF